MGAELTSSRAISSSHQGGWHAFRRGPLHWGRRKAIRQNIASFLLFICALVSTGEAAAANEAIIRYFPSGSIYEYRWKLLELALAHTQNADGLFRLEPYPEEVTQNRGMQLLEFGDIDVVALGTNAEREARVLPIKIDILRGIVGYRLMVIRASDQERFGRMDAHSLRTQVTFGLNSQWADLAIMQANNFNVVTATNYEALFGMLVGQRFDAFPRGLNEAARELSERKQTFPSLAIEDTKALYFPYPVYFWVRKTNTALAHRIERGLKLSLADGSFRKLFEEFHAAEIAALDKKKRHVIRLTNPLLPPGSTEPDTSWWWH